MVSQTKTIDFRPKYNDKTNRKNSDRSGNGNAVVVHGNKPLAGLRYHRVYPVADLRGVGLWGQDIFSHPEH